MLEKIIKDLFPRAETVDVVALLYYAGCFDRMNIELHMKREQFGGEDIKATLEALQSAGINTAERAEPEKDFTRINPVLLLNAFAKTEPQKALNWLISVTQEHCFARSAGEERWEQQTGLWMKAHEDKIRALAEKIGISTEQTPKYNIDEYSCGVNFGSTLPNMKWRLGNAAKCLETATKPFTLYALAGERAISEKIDGKDIDLRPQLAEKGYQNLPEQLTETEVCKLALHHVFGEELAFTESDDVGVSYVMKGGKHNGSQMKILDTKTPTDQRRPTSVDTLKYLREHIKLEGKVLFFSSAPHIDSQATDTCNVLSDLGIEIDVVGPACGEGTPINRIVGAFAGYMFGRYPDLCVHYQLQPSLEDATAARNAHLKYDAIKVYKREASAQQALVQKGSSVAVEQPQKPVQQDAEQLQDVQSKGNNFN